MTPQEKAQGLWVKYYERLPDSIYSNYAAKMEAKYFALIAVDEIIDSNPYKLSLEGKFLTEHITYDINFWQEVKQEIEKI